MVHFVYGTHFLEAGEGCDTVMDLCEKAESDSSMALDCWSLLRTTFHDAHVAAGDSADDDTRVGRRLRLLPLLLSCLNTSDTELWRAAGECASLIHKCRLNLGLEDKDACNATKRRYRRGWWEGSEWQEVMDEVS